jgi:hypothetical protein
LATVAGIALALNVNLNADDAKPADGPLSKYPDFAGVVKGAKVYGGDAGKPTLFTMYQKDDHLYAELTPMHFDRPFMFAAAVAKGAGMGGTTLIGNESWVLYFKKVGEKVFLVRKNTRMSAKANTPAGKATDTTYSDSILISLPIKTINPIKMSTVVDLSNIFFSDFTQLNLGYLDPSRTTWHKVKTFPKNVELQVAATFSGRAANPLAMLLGMGNNDGVIDSRGVSVILHYSLIDMPDSGYTPRAADDRVGHFTSVLKDFTAADGRDSAFVRYVNRWRLERADGSTWKEGGKLVPPKKKIVFWIENSVPDEYRAAVREGILEWNKAFEKIGFRDAIEVRQQEGEDFDPEDITYATFRWITSETPYAIGPSRANPLTGELIDADILFDASMVRANKSEFRIYRNDKGEFFEPASVMQADRRGWMTPLDPLAWHRPDGGWDTRSQIPNNDPELMLRAKLNALKHGYCQCAHHKTNELGLAITALAADTGAKPGTAAYDEIIQQAVKETVMHEVGHTLGLRHNFKASTMHPNEKLHDKTLTRKVGLVGSVMDYNPANIAGKGVTQGDYFSTTIGPYDYWAIEYAYKPNCTDEDLSKIASRAADPQLIYGTDEDVFATSDPNINRWDMGADPLKFAKDRMQLAKELMPKLTETVVDQGEGYQRARGSFFRLLGQYGDAAFIASKYVGGEIMHRDHKGDANARDPFVPVNPARQREALKFLQTEILTDAPFTFPPELLRKLAADRWLHWGNPGAMRSVDLPLNQHVASIHKVALEELLDPEVLSRMQNTSLKMSKDEKPVTVAELLRGLTDSIFADLPAKSAKAEGKSSVIRRNLQRAYVTELSSLLVKGNSRRAPADARSLARAHLKEIMNRLQTNSSDDETVKAFMDETKEQIAKVLDAKITLYE